MFKDALEIVKKLNAKGFTAYFAGGWVRDYVMETQSIDIDIATDATPDDVIKLFEKTIPIGKAFGVVLVMINNVGYEVASFRKDNLYIDGRHPESIEFSTPQEDAQRRDFTINGLFYSPLEEKVLDYVDGLPDIENKCVRAIGDPFARFSEDKLRMIRAIRFSSRLGFTIDKHTENAIRDLSSSLYPSVSKERVNQELKKMGEHKTFPKSIVELKRLGLLDTIFPLLKSVPISEVDRISQALDHHIHHAYLLTLACYFKDFEEQAVLTAFEDLKLSGQEKLDLLYGLFIQKIIKKGQDVTNSEWVQLFAHPLIDRAISIILSLSTGFTQEQFEEIAFFLSSHIERRKKGTTLLTSRDLLSEGITPGKKMGELLRAADTLAIEQNIKHSSHVLNRLKETALWTQ